MRKGITYFSHYIFYSFLAFFSLELTAHHAVTYETLSSRFGDNLLSYCHSKWLAYKYNIPLLYRPFIYSDQLRMHLSEIPYKENSPAQFDHLITLGEEVDINLSDPSSNLYYVRYFPESKWELENGKNYEGGRWESFVVDWDDPGFKKVLKEMVSPLYFKPNFSFPNDRISVALHIRRGGSYDSGSTRKGFPSKFLPDAFFISQIRNTYYLLGEKPLYVYIFTDDHHPERIIKKYQRHLSDFNIQWDYRKKDNNENSNILEDFFAMTQFDCLIHSESNYSLCASKIGDYLISIYPDSFKEVNGKVEIDHVVVKKNF